MDRYPVDTFVSKLAENDLLDIEKLDGETLADLSACFIRSTPTKYLPILENFDKRRELITMLGGWLETRNDDMKDQIMEHLEELVVKAFMPAMENVLESYRIREERAIEEAAAEREVDNYLFERSRI